MNNRSRGLLSRMLLAGASSAAIAIAAPAWGQEAPRTFDIPAQPLSSALMVYSNQADTPVVASMELLQGKTAPAVRGQYSEQIALQMLLEGSGLRATRGASGGLVVERMAQSPQGGSAAGDVDALIVTAQKREEDIQDVPIAISAFSQEALERSQIAGGPDLITQVPNMTFTKTNFSSYSIQIRGIGTQAISATTDPAVAVAFNNTPFMRNRFFEQEFYDLQRVEVLRGPQGTLYGRNATAGVVNIISAKPVFNAESKASVDLGNFESRRFEGMVNIPLVEDKVALRLAGAWTTRNGYATNEITGQPIDGRDLWSTRLSLRFSPTDSINANLIWEHFEEDDDRLRSGKQTCKKHVVTEMDGIPVTYTQQVTGGVGSYIQSLYSQGCERNSLYAADSYQTPNGLALPYYHPLGTIFLPINKTPHFDPYLSTVQSPDLRVIESVVNPEYRAESDLFELQLDWDLSDSLRLSSETAYSADTVFSMQDFNRFNTAPDAWADSLHSFGFYREGVLNDGVFCDPQIGCSDRLVGLDLSTAKSRQFSQEFRLASDFDGPLNFSLGANFLRYDTVDKYYVFINALGLFAAVSPYKRVSPLSPYVPDMSDNSECLIEGLEPPDPNLAYGVTGCIYMDPNPIGSLNDQGHNYFLSKNPFKLMSYAAFGEVYYELADNLKITGGLRWTVDKKEAPLIPSWILANQSVGYPVAEVIEQEWREPTGRLTIDWKPDLGFTDETLLYASYAHGYKAGGVNPPLPGMAFYHPVDDEIKGVQRKFATHPRTFDPEFLDAFEIGSKNTFLDGRATLNLAAFYYDYQGYQISEIVDRSALNRNFDAEVWGVEVESDWRPLENLRLGVKGGYQKTRLADGSQAVDLMDRTAGNPDWLVVRPFPTYPSNCILPLYTIIGDNDQITTPGEPGGGLAAGCEIAYIMGRDPVTNLPYVPNPTVGGVASNLDSFTDYPGFDPLTAPNNGEGFYKDLSGNELPNAPNWTATVTADYTIPLPNDWLATLHTDLHWQSESYWRVFQDHEYSTLDEYFTMNLAAILTNEERGWKIMAYIKNVTDETAITGAFLNSDDSMLTTNVFLTEPRLYGLRVTKDWGGGPLLGGFGERREGPYPLTVEIGGHVQRHDARAEAMQPGFSSIIPAPLDIFGQTQDDDLDWGDGREVKLTYRPTSGPWFVSAGVRYGRTNGVNAGRAQSETEPVCGFGGDYAFLCEMYADREGATYDLLLRLTKTNASNTSVIDHEEHQVVDFAVGKDVGLGVLARSSVQLGLRYLELDAMTDARLESTPDWFIPPGWYYGVADAIGTHHRNTAAYRASRDFEGAGPTVAWDASYPFLGNADVGRVQLDWSVTGGVLFGRQETTINGLEQERFYEATGYDLARSWTPAEPQNTPISFERSKSITVPTLDLSLGLSYRIDGMSIGAGYRWERYFDALDGGFAEEKSVDRTIDGPYFKIAVGFGG